jgi:hypothetical protein
MAGTVFSLVVTALVICKIATRVRVDADGEFDDLPWPPTSGPESDRGRGPDFQDATKAPASDSGNGERRVTTSGTPVQRRGGAGPGCGPQPRA